MTAETQTSAATASAALRRASGHCAELSTALDQAASAFTSGGLARHQDQLAKLIEFHRLVATRVAVLANRVAEEGP